MSLLLVAFAVGTSWTELRGLFKMPTSKFGFFRSRFSLAIAYGWIGTYCLGGVVTGDQGWITLARLLLLESPFPVGHPNRGFVALFCSFRRWCINNLFVLDSIR